MPLLNILYIFLNPKTPKPGTTNRGFIRDLNKANPIRVVQQANPKILRLLSRGQHCRKSHKTLGNLYKLYVHYKSPNLSFPHRTVHPNLRLCVWAILSAKLDRFVVLIAMVCTSFSAVNRATNRRDILTPYGDASRDYVVLGNCMLERRLCRMHSVCCKTVGPQRATSVVYPRCICLALLIMARGGSYILEQPGQSAFLHHPRVEWLRFRENLPETCLEIIQACTNLALVLLSLSSPMNGPSSLSKVFSVRWWMRHYWSATPKPQVALSNNPGVKRFDMGRLLKAQRPTNKALSTTSKYKNAQGKKCFVGTKYLKTSQTLPQLYEIASPI